jgi:hypothetical protein
MPLQDSCFAGGLVTYKWAQAKRMIDMHWQMEWCHCKKVSTSTGFAIGWRLPSCQSKDNRDRNTKWPLGQVFKSMHQWGACIMQVMLGQGGLGCTNCTSTLAILCAHALICRAMVTSWPRMTQTQSSRHNGISSTSAHSSRTRRCLTCTTTLCSCCCPRRYCLAQVMASRASLPSSVSPMHLAQSMDHTVPRSALQRHWQEPRCWLHCHRHAHQTPSGPLAPPHQPPAPSPTLRRTVVRTLLVSLAQHACSHAPQCTPSQPASSQHSPSFPNAHALHITDITPDTTSQCPLLRTCFRLTAIDTDLSSSHMLTPTSCTTRS